MSDLQDFLSDFVQLFSTSDVIMNPKDAGAFSADEGKFPLEERQGGYER